MILNLSSAAAWAQISKMLCKPVSWFTQGYVVGWPQGAAESPASPCSFRWAQISQGVPSQPLAPLCPQAAGAAAEAEVAWAVCKPCSAITAAWVCHQHHQHWFVTSWKHSAMLLLWRKLILSLPNPAQPMAVRKSLVQRSVLAVLLKKEYLVALGTLRNFFMEKQLQSLQHAFGAGQSFQYCPEAGK